MKFLIHLSYKGTRYHGWQRQARHLTVQEVLEDALEKMTGTKINCIGCGRTDAGVHASQYFCHIKVEENFSYDPVFRLNKMLPDDIAIHEFIPADWDLHAQHDAVSRTYNYRIHTVPDAFLSDLSAFYTQENLDVERMQAAIKILTLQRDFRSMCRHPELYKTTICDLTEARLPVFANGKRLEFTFTADRFLRAMVRILVGQILQIGYGRLRLEAFENCFKTGQPPARFKLAHPQGLYLSGVRYGFLAGE
jgi:tRNA pseudouridine38-40 synthase